MDQKEKLKSPKPSIPVRWYWDVSKFYVEKEKWFVEGYCTTYDIDQAGDQVTEKAAQIAVKELLGNTLLHNHNPDVEIGVVVAAKVDDKGIWIKCLVSKTVPDIWIKINEGVLSKFSIRMREVKSESRWRKGRKVRVIYSMQIPEVSLTSLPCNLGSQAAHAYVGKSYQEDLEMPVSEGMKVLQDAVQGLIKDFKSGKITETTKSTEAGTEEIIKQDGEPCPLKGTENCPVLKEGTPEEIKAIAGKCPEAKNYACPFLEKAKSDEKGTKTEDTKAAEEKFCIKDDGTTVKANADGTCPAGSAPAPPLEDVKTAELSTRIGTVEKCVEDLKESITSFMERFSTKMMEQVSTEIEGVKTKTADLETKYSEVLKDTEQKTKAAAEKIKTLEGNLTAKSTQINADDDHTKENKSFWKGAMPF